MNYRIRFWVADYEFDDLACDEVRTAIHYAFQRRGVEIPYPIQIEYSRDWQPPDQVAAQRERESRLSDVDILATLSDTQRRDLAAATLAFTYGNDEAIVRQGQPGESMFVVCSGEVAVVLEPDGREVATIGKGGYFGEMSLLTGEPRTATVVARGETVVLELHAQAFRKLASESPQAVEQVGVAAMARRAELDRVRSSAPEMAVAIPPATLLGRMKKFLGL